MRNKIVTLFFLCFIVSMGILHIATEDKAFSEHENRVLASFPKFSAKRLFSGKFTDAFETYVTDQFFGKDVWVGIKAKAEQTLGKQENNGVYFGDNGYLLESYEWTDEQIAKNIAYINHFSEQLADINMYMLLAPNAVAIYPEFLPRFALSDNQTDALDSINMSLNDVIHFIDVYDRLMTRKNEPIYFRTDHHWTMRGAYYAYVEAAKQMDLTPLTEDAFDIQKVSHDFYGTHYSKANDFVIKPDDIEYYKPKTDHPVEVFYDQEDVAHDLVTWDALNTKDQYSFFLDGNHRIVKIYTEHDNGKKLAVLKDSYAHALIPFLTHHYEEIHVLDLRYFHDSVTDYIKKQDISDALLLYNLATFSNDTNLIWLKR